jgi:hypothetical protein
LCQPYQLQIFIFNEWIFRCYHVILQHHWLKRTFDYKKSFCFRPRIPFWLAVVTARLTSQPRRPTPAPATPLPWWPGLDSPIRIWSSSSSTPLVNSSLCFYVAKCWNCLFYNYKTAQKIGKLSFNFIWVPSEIIIQNTDLRIHYM